MAEKAVKLSPSSQKLETAIGGWDATDPTSEVNGRKISGPEYTLCTTDHPIEKIEIEKIGELDELKLLHSGAARPATPPPPPPTSLDCIPLRYPETLNKIIEICATENKGLGVFASNDIEPGTIVLCEAPMISFTDPGTRPDALNALVSALPPAQRASYRSLHAFKHNANETRNRSIMYCNGYSVSDFGSGIFETASRINHSCVPNSLYFWKESIGRMIFYSRFKILAGEEVTVDYGHRGSRLKKIYGFDCMCGGCTEAGSDGAELSGGSEKDGWSSGSENGGVLAKTKGIEEILEGAVAVPSDDEQQVTIVEEESAKDDLIA